MYFLHKLLITNCLLLTTYYLLLITYYFQIFMPAKYNIEYIDRSDRFGDAVAHLSAAEVVAFDLEFDSSRYSYGFTLCLIQICTSSRCFIIDPLAKLDLQPLWQVFENPKIMKIAHCGEQDLRLLHSIGCRPKEVRDTETMAKLLDYEFFGLAHLLKEKFGFEMDKKLQVSNWNARPLRPAQIEYAANDVIFLFDLHHNLLEQAKAKGIEQWIIDETSAVNTVSYDEAPTEDFLSKADRKECTEAEQYILNELLKLRDQSAKQYNKPPYQIIDNQLLRDLVMGKEDFADWMSFKVYKAVRSLDFQALIAETYEEAQAEAQRLKLNTAGRRRQTPEERAAASRLLAERERLRLLLFRPIQAVMVERHGLNTSRYLFSESYITLLLRQQTRLSQLRTPYRRQMISDIAKELNIDLTAYE